MLAEEELTQLETVQQAVEWVKHEAEARHVMAVIPSGQAEERQGDYYTFLMIPVEMPALETDEFLQMLGKIQNKWNDQEPRPEKLLFLYPAGVPRHAV
jgi:hypothetical protein